MGTVLPDQQQSPARQAGGAEGTEVEVVSHRYSTTGKYELYSSDGVKFLVNREHLAGSTLLALVQHTKEIHLQETFADEKAVHLLLDFQSATFTPPSTPRSATPVAGLDRLLPCLKLANRYEFGVQAELIHAIVVQLQRREGGSPLDVFVTASELDSPDLAEAAVRAMVNMPGSARQFSPIGWSAETFAAVTKPYLWAFMRCFVSRSAPEQREDYALEAARFMPALFEYNELEHFHGPTPN